MDDSCEQIIETTELVQEEPASHITNACDIFQPAGVRRSLRFCDEVNRIILDDRPRFLFRVCPLLWFIFLSHQK